MHPPSPQWLCKATHLKFVSEGTTGVCVATKGTTLGGVEGSGQHYQQVS